MSIANTPTAAKSDWHTGFTRRCRHILFESFRCCSANVTASCRCRRHAAPSFSSRTPHLAHARTCHPRPKKVSRRSILRRLAAVSLDPSESGMGRPCPYAHWLLVWPCAALSGGKAPYLERTSGGTAPPVRYGHSPLSLSQTRRGFALPCLHGSSARDTDHTPLARIIPSGSPSS